MRTRTIFNKQYTDIETIELMRIYIASNYERIKHAAMSIAGPMYKDLVQDIVLSLLSSKRFPEDLFIRGREFLYIYGTMKRTYYSKQKPWKPGYFTPTSEFNSVEDKEYIENDNLSDKLYEEVFQIVLNLDIPEYDKNCFLLYFYPDKANSFLNLSDAQMKTLMPKENKSSYRSIEKVTGINFQSVRYTTNLVLEKVKKKISLHI